MSLDVKSVKKALQDAGVEVYRSKPDEVHVAERIRLHIMDSHVRVVLGEPMKVRFTARSQRSDFPNSRPDELLERVRHRVGGGAIERGYVETSSQVQEIKNPVDETKTLDVWYEVVYEKPAGDLDEVIDEVRWALGLEKFVRE